MTDDSEACTEQNEVPCPVGGCTRQCRFEDRVAGIEHRLTSLEAKPDRVTRLVLELQREIRDQRIKSEHAHLELVGRFESLFSMLTAMEVIDAE